MSGGAFPTGFALCTSVPPGQPRNSTATSDADLDADTAIQDEVRNAARTLLEGVRAKLEGKLVTAGENLRPPRQK